MVAIRPYNSSEAVTLANIWRNAVEATHDFLTAADIDGYYVQVRDIYLSAVEVWVATDDAGRPVGFIGLSDNKVEMLFVDPAQKGKGYGTALLDHAFSLKNKLAVDVNEQNPQAHGFYLHYGFVQTGRSETDSEGKPFPIIHMVQP